MNTNPYRFSDQSIFAEAANNWNLDKLYLDLTNAKQSQGSLRRKPITPIEKACLRGLLSSHTPSEIALQLNRSPIGLRVDLSRGLYRYIEMLTGCPLKDWSKVAQILAAAGYGNFEPQIPVPLSPKFSSVKKAVQSLDDDENRWVGRTMLLSQLTESLLGNCRILSLVGITGIGKSTLAIRLALELKSTEIWSTMEVISFDVDQNSFLSFANKILGGQTLTLQNSSKLLVDRLCSFLRSQPCLLILDMVENILVVDDQGKNHFLDPAFILFFDQVLQSENMPSRLILTSQGQVPVMAAGRYRSRSHIEQIQGLDYQESLELFLLWNVKPSNAQEIEYLQHIIKTYQGYPLALQVIAREIFNFPYHSDISAYWQDYGQELMSSESRQNDSPAERYSHPVTLAYYSISLADFVKSRIEQSLRRLQDLAPLAYKLLCWGSIYRNPVDRASWLSLMTDSTREEQILAFQTLQRSFLLEVDYISGQVSYRLHRLIQSVVLQHWVMLERQKGASPHMGKFTGVTYLGTVESLRLLTEVYISQECPNCRTVVTKSLSTRTHVCRCGCELDRDHDAAINIMNKGLGTAGHVGTFALVGEASWNETVRNAPEETTFILVGRAARVSPE